MMKSFKMIGVAGLMAGALIVAGCGSDNGTTTTTTAATTTTTAATTTTTAVPTTTTTTLPPVINVSAATTPLTSDASTADSSYVFASGTYTYTISGFGAGDKLTFPAGITPTVFNDSWTDGTVQIWWADSATGNKITVVLTGLGTNDSSLNSIAAFNTAFGPGTIN